MTTRTRKFVYSALCYTQRSEKGTPQFILFHAPAAEIVEWADVDRLSPDNPTGAQRPLRGLKVKKVARFFERDKRNTIPTAVVVALDKSRTTFQLAGTKGKHNSTGTLTISLSGSSKAGLIIDGQHRVFGASGLQESIQLNIVALLGGDDAERAFQFVVINNSASRVTQNHIRSLNLQYDKDALNDRLLKSAGVALGLADTKYEDFQLIDNGGPFKGLLAWPTNPNGFIPPNAIEGALSETRDRAALIGVEDLERDFLLAVWQKIKEKYPIAWRKDTDGHPSHLLQKVSIQALTIYILDSLEAAQRTADTPLDFTNEDQLSQYVDRVVGRIPETFWTTPWTATGLDTSAGRQILFDALKVIDSNARFNRPWYDRVQLIDPADLEGQAADVKAKRSPRPTKKK
jgi:hypothetical protein